METDVIAERLKNLITSLNEHREENRETNSRIEQQVMKTNGRVKSLEKWKAAVLGMVAMISFFSPVLFFLYKDSQDHSKEDSKQLLQQQQSIQNLETRLQGMEKEIIKLN